MAAMIADVARSLLFVAFAGAIPVLGVVGPSGTGDAERIATYRAEIDDLAAELEAERVAARDELASLRAERAELERQVRAARARAAALGQIQAEMTTRVEAEQSEARRWNDPTRRAIAAARSHIERSLPFARERRLAVLDRIDRDLQVAQPDYARAVERLWRFLEEEEAMTREVSLSQHEMDIDGKAQIVEVVRLSMALLYFRTEDGRYGWVAPGSDGWQRELLEDPRAIEVVRARFDAFGRSEALGPAALLLPDLSPASPKDQAP